MNGIRVFALLGALASNYATAQDRLMGPTELRRRANEARASEVERQLHDALSEVEDVRRSRAPAAAPPTYWAPGWPFSDEFEKGRIVNWVVTVLYPTVGALLTGPDADNAFSHCTGTLIGCKTFLTADHCVSRDGSDGRVIGGRRGSGDRTSRRRFL